MSRNIAITVATFLAAFCYFGIFVSYGINLDDEGTILYQIERTLDGQTPYIDFHIGYTPATFYVHAALMKVFGVSVIPVRWLLALANSAALAGLVALTARAAVWWIAPVPALLYLVSIPIHGGEFASFNIPYPAWYTAGLFIWSMYCMLRYGESGATRWLATAAALAGLDFAFKPNAGLFNLAAASFVMLAVIPFAGLGRRWFERRFRKVGWWMLWAATLGGVWFVFVGNGGAREVGIFLLPMTIAALGVGWRSMVAEPAPEQPELFRSAAILLGTFVLVNLPWMVPVLLLLGPIRFANDVLFIGTGFEEFYYIAHSPVALLAAVFLAVGAVLGVVGKIAVARRWPTDVIGIAAFVAGILGLLVAATLSLMPEGFLAAVRSEYEARILALTLAVNLLGLFRWAATIGIGEAARLPSIRTGTLVVGALAMYLQLYPRTDYMHWVQAAPLSLALGATLLARFTVGWASAVKGGRRAVAVSVCVAPVLVVAGLRAAPAFVAAFDLDGVIPRRAAHVELGLERAPVWMNAGRAVRYRDLAGVVEFVRHETASDETVFTFPNLDIISFLSDRHNPTRHGYFYPEWPGREVEAEVTGELEVSAPRLSVVLHRHPLFFMNAPLYYYSLRSFMNSRYVPYTEFGPYSVVINRDDTEALSHAVAVDGGASAASIDAPLAEPITRDLASGDAVRRLAALGRIADLRFDTHIPVIGGALADPSQQVRDGAVWALKGCLDPRCARPLARALRNHLLSAREATLAARIIGNSGGPDAARPLLMATIGGTDRAADEAATALYHLVSRATVGEYWFVHRDIFDDQRRIDRLPRAPALRRRVLRWIAREAIDPRYRLYAVWASQSADRDEAIEALGGAARASRNHEDPAEAALERAGSGTAAAAEAEMSAKALLGLAARGGGKGAFGDVVELLEDDDVFAPTTMIELAKQTMGLDQRLARLILSGRPKQRVRAAWLAAQIGGERTMVALAQALDHSDPQMRMAAIWAFEHRGERGRIEHIRPLLDDPSFLVRGFAERALVRLEGSPP